MDQEPRSTPPPGWLAPGNSAASPAPAPSPSPSPSPSQSPPPAARRPDDPFGEERQPLLRRIFGPLLVAGAFVLKFGKLALLALPKLKLLTTSGTMLVSVAAYSLIWGWRFAFGFVVLLFVHEMGHVIQLRREGIKASAPVFIPFLGAAVWAKSLGDDAAAEARVGLAGPVLGTIGAAACIPLASLTGNDLFTALAFTGFFLNLFNLLPIVPLDGGRAMAAMSPWMWLVGVFAMVIAVITFPNPIIILIAILGVFETYRRFKALRSGDEKVRAYYRVTPRQRIVVGLVYVGLIAALVLGMDATHLQRTISDARG